MLSFSKNETILSNAINGSPPCQHRSIFFCPFVFIKPENNAEYHVRKKAYDGKYIAIIVSNRDK